jgi:hypothetical protein
MTHSRLVMLIVLGGGLESDAAIKAGAMLLVVDGTMGGALSDTVSRAAIEGAADTEDVGVETEDRDAAEAGLDTELGEF